MLTVGQSGGAGQVVDPQGPITGDMRYPFQPVDHRTRMGGRSSVERLVADPSVPSNDPAASTTDVSQYALDVPLSDIPAIVSSVNALNSYLPQAQSNAWY